MFLSTRPGVAMKAEISTADVAAPVSSVSKPSTVLPTGWVWTPLSRSSTPNTQTQSTGRVRWDPNMPYYTISKFFEFSAAHHLTGLPDDHPCSRVHGHNYVV